MATLALTGCSDTFVPDEYEEEFFEKIEFCRKNNMRIEIYDALVENDGNGVYKVECTFKITT